jgi:hypothetical protein
MKCRVDGRYAPCLTSVGGFHDGACATCQPAPLGVQEEHSEQVVDIVRCLCCPRCATIVGMDDLAIIAHGPQAVLTGHSKVIEHTDAAEAHGKLHPVGTSIHRFEHQWRGCTCGESTNGIDHIFAGILHRFERSILYRGMLIICPAHRVVGRCGNECLSLYQRGAYGHYALTTEFLIDADVKILAGCKGPYLCEVVLQPKGPSPNGACAVLCLDRWAGYLMSRKPHLVIELVDGRVGIHIIPHCFYTHHA